MSEYRFERLSDNNLKDLIFLYQHSFNEKTDLSFLRQKYDTEAFGLKYAGFIAYSTNNNEPAAYYGVFPITVSWKGKEYLAAQSGDTMTHPNHRGKGLFITLAKMTYDLAKDNNVQFVFGFPNENSYPGFVKKLHWNHYGNINNYKLSSGSLPFEKLAKKYNFIGSFYKSYTSKLLKKLKTQKLFENSIVLQSSGSGYVPHNSKYCNYKQYYDSYIVELNGVHCWIKLDGRLWVGDIEFCDEIKFRETIIALKLLAKKLKCSAIHFSVFENSVYDNYLKKYAVSYYKNAVGCLNLHELKGENFMYQSADFDTF